MTQTIGDFYKSLPKNQAEIVDVVIGAAVDGEDLSENPDIVAAYDALPDMVKYFIDFVVGGSSAIDTEVEHSDLRTGEFLEHFGVKGMRWGVRKSETYAKDPSGTKTIVQNKMDRGAMRARVYSGNGTLGEAHLAGLKSRGHRIANALLGDKRYWTTRAKILGASVLGVGVAMATPSFLPSGLLQDLGRAAHSSMADNPFVPKSVFESAGKKIATGIGLTAVGIGSNVASGTAAVTNLGRAIRGNARISKSYNALGEEALRRQTEGSKQVQKTLRKSGSIRKNALR